MSKQFPDYLLQEIRNTVALQCRDAVMTGKTGDGEKTHSQELMMEKVFHWNFALCGNEKLQHSCVDRSEAQNLGSYWLLRVVERQFNPATRYPARASKRNNDSEQHSS